MGNPPFVGARNKTPEQSADMMSIFVDAKGKPLKTAGNIDYVAAWYWKACEYSAVAGRHALPTVGSAHPALSSHRDSLRSGDTRADRTRCAFVSTNSITQGEQVAAVWKPLKERFGIEIDYAWTTFVWDSEATEKAHVHVVIVGFHAGSIQPCRGGEVEKKRLYHADGSIVEAHHINGYLMDGPDVCVESNRKAYCELPLIFGSMPNDGGCLSNYDDAAKELIVAKYPQANALFRKLTGSQESINNISRWCLWLKDVSPKVIRSIPPVLEAVEKVRAMRLASKREATRKLADTPHLFGEIRQPERGKYLLIPKVSSERRKYVPMSYYEATTIATDLAFIVPNATLYHFGVLTSSVHMAWMRVVAGRLKSDYRYSAAIVYNNFPWPCGALGDRPLPSPVGADHRAARNEVISRTAQAILDARALYPDSSLADLYDPLTMPPELRKAHAANDAAVMKAYGFPADLDEAGIVSRLFEMYAKMAGKMK